MCLSELHPSVPGVLARQTSEEGSVTCRLLHVLELTHGQLVRAGEGNCPAS